MFLEVDLRSIIYARKKFTLSHYYDITQHNITLGKPPPSFRRAYALHLVLIKNKPKRSAAYLMSASLLLEHRLSSAQTLSDPWRVFLLMAVPKRPLVKGKVPACSANSDQSITVKRDFKLHVTPCHRSWKEISCPPNMQTFSKNAAGFLLGSTDTIFKLLP